ncbi:MAG: sigma 54-interacting transcriptional regulator [Halieaceae bacterium]
MGQWDGTELTLPEVAAATAQKSRQRLALTILFHPDGERIGERALLPQRRPLELARQSPLFTSLRGTGADQALLDQYLSRSPITICRSCQGVELSVPAGGSSLLINGACVESRVRLADSELDAGVLMSLSHRVVLLLHRCELIDELPQDCGLVGESDALQQVRSMIMRVAAAPTPVLLLGESGTGKELVARAIHDHSARCAHPLVAVNMAAIPGELAPAELFGVRAGAFTGADTDRDGYFREADGGTLFLDEIGACTSSVQAQLLRALEQGEIQSPGGSTEQVDVRVLAATDADLEGSEGGFSTALRHRLGGFEIQLPPLRERREDLGRLLQYFLPSSLLQAAAVSPRMVAQWVMLVQQLADYNWPGNVRELANFCQQISIASGAHDQLLVPANIYAALSSQRSSAGKRARNNPKPATDLSDNEVREAMMAAQWEISGAARDLQVSRQALYRRIQLTPGLRVTADIPAVEIEAAYHECKGAVDAAAMHLQVSRAALRRRWRAMELIPRDY